MEKNLLKEAKQAENVEELLALAKEENYPLEREEAENLFTQLHASGEISDEELDSVSGGGCKTKVNGKKYVVVTTLKSCFTGRHECGFQITRDRWGVYGYGACLNTDNVGLRDTWRFAIPVDSDVCGNCKHLKFKGATGYCGLSEC